MTGMPLRDALDRRRRRRPASRWRLPPAATTAAFYAFFPTDYRGVSELGLIAGSGMIIAFLTSITLLPALLVLLKPPGEPREVGYRALAPVDRFMARHRIAILTITALCVAAGIARCFERLQFDFNPINLRSNKVESVSTFNDLMKDPATAPNTIEILTALARRCRGARRENRPSSRSRAVGHARELRA